MERSGFRKRLQLPGVFYGTRHLFPLDSARLPRHSHGIYRFMNTHRGTAPRVRSRGCEAVRLASLRVLTGAVSGAIPLAPRFIQIVLYSWMGRDGTHGRMDAWTLSTRATQPYLDILKSALIYQTHVSVPHWPLTKVAISPCLIHAVDNQVSITKLIFK